MHSIIGISYQIIGITLILVSKSLVSVMVSISITLLSVTKSLVSVGISIGITLVSVAKSLVSIGISCQITGISGGINWYHLPNHWYQWFSLQRDENYTSQTKYLV